MKEIVLPSLIGAVCKFSSNGKILSVKRLRKDYFALIDGHTEGRFGNATQIREDIQYFLDGGGLPRDRNLRV